MRANVIDAVGYEFVYVGSVAIHRPWFGFGTTAQWEKKIRRAVARQYERDEMLERLTAYCADLNRRDSAIRTGETEPVREP